MKKNTFSLTLLTCLIIATQSSLAMEQQRTGLSATSIASIDAILPDGQTRLTSAVIEANKNIADALPKIKKLLDDGANVNARNRGGWTPLMFAATIPDAQDLIKLLLDYGADTSLKNSMGRTALGIAQDSLGRKKYIGLGYDKLLEEKVGLQPAAFEAKAQPSKPVVLSAPAPEAKIQVKPAAAAPTSAVSVAGIDAILPNGETQLINAVKEARENKAAALPKIKSLLDQGANVNAKNKTGWTPLMWAVSIGDALDLVELLMHRGADPDLANNAGMTARSAADTFGQRGYLPFLYKR